VKRMSEGEKKHEEPKKKADWKADNSLTMVIKKSADWKPDEKLTMRLEESVGEKITENKAVEKNKEKNEKK
jgi:hypothetical protein